MGIKQKLQDLAQKTLGISQAVQMWLAGTDMPDANSARPTRPYAQVDLVFACTNKLINGIAGLPLVLSTIDDRIVESGPVYDLLFSNPAMTWERFLTDTVGHYALSRDVFWVFIDTEGRRPKEIMVVSGTQMKPVTHNRRPNGVLIGWEFRGRNGERAYFDIDDVHQWKNFNPYDKFHGLGPATASKLSIDYSYAASLFNTASLENAAEPGAILTTPGKLDEDQIRLIRSQWDSRHAGPAKAKRTAVLSGGLDVKTIAMKLRDMEIAKIGQMSDVKLCATFGVNPELVGIITEAQYSHGPAQRDFIFNTIIPLAALFGGELTSGIISRFLSSESRSVELKDSKTYKGYRTRSLMKKPVYRKARYKAVNSQQQVFAWFDIDQHPTVQEAQRETSEKVLKFTESGVPLNDLIEAHDLPYEQVPWGDDWWIGMGQVPASYALEAGLEGITGPSLAEGDTSGEDDGKAVSDILGDMKDLIAELKAQDSFTKSDEQQRLRIWQNWVVSWAGIEREYNESMRKFFLRQQRILIDKLKKVLAGSKSVKATPDEIIARVVFDLKIENTKLKVIHQTFFKKASELGARQTLTEAGGLTGDALTEAADQVQRTNAVKAKLTISTHKIVKVNQTTQNMIAKQLRHGLEAGEGLNELTKRLQKASGFNRKRAQRIARTSTAGAVDTGRHEGMRHAGVELKSWITSGDNDVRPSHVAAGSKYASGIPLDQPFVVGGESLMYPSDPSGSAGNIINCRCLHIARKAKGKSFDLSHYANMKFYSYSDMKDK